MYLFFDTETTGLPENFRAPHTDTDNWPRVIQLAWVLADEKGEAVEQESLIIKPDGFTIPEESAQIHGITTEQALAQGVDLHEALDAFEQALGRAQALVAHNISFDVNVMGAEYVRTEGDTSWLETPQVCTMKRATPYCQLPGRYGYRWPKLIELHEILFEEDFSGAHDALADVQACRRCFFELRERGVVDTQKL